MNKIKIYILSFLIVTLSIGIGSAQTVPIPDILHFEFDNQSSLGESTTLAVDGINAHEGVISNMADYTTGKIGNATDLTGSTPSYITIADHDDLSRGIPPFHDDDRDFTISFSIKCDDYSNILILEKANEYKLETIDGILTYTQHDNLWSGDFIKRSTLDLTRYNGGDYIHIVLTGRYPTGAGRFYVNNEYCSVPLNVPGVTYEGMHNTDSDLIIGDTSTDHNMCIDGLQMYTYYLDDRDVEYLYYSIYEGNPAKMRSMWELIQDVVSNLGALINMIVLVIVMTCVIAIGGWIKSFVKIT